jgi:uncharacterized protein YbjT (DUF2867 family)
MKILVTGTAGFIASRTVSMLLEQGHIGERFEGGGPSWLGADGEAT